ncbi:hypothetical protein ACNOYE_22485 [Nannocystaceae bacterium ST9]
MVDEPFNPYAPPKSDWVYAPNPAALTPQQWWFEGDTLVVLRGASLPADLCVKTGQPTHEPPVQRKLQWIHPLVAISVISPIIFVILYLIFRKTAELGYGVSRELIQRRKIGLALILGPILPLAGLIALAGPGNPGVIGLAAVAWVVMLLVGIVRMTPFQVKKIDKEKIYLKVDDRFRRALEARR